MVSLTKPFDPAPAGNMISGPKPGDEAMPVHYTYDALYRLTDTAEYQYDGTGRRIVKGVDDDSDGSLDTFTHFFHNRDNQVLETREGDDVSGAAPAAETLNPKHQSIWSPRYIDSLILRDECDAQGDIITANRLYYLNDANYNVTALLDATGAVVERYLYTPYGTVTVLDPDFSVDADGKSDYDNTTLYTGREFDAETELMYYRARYYHSELGRFVSRDPIGYGGGRTFHRSVQGESNSLRKPIACDGSTPNRSCLPKGQKASVIRRETASSNLYTYCNGSPAVHLDPSGAVVEVCRSIESTFIFTPSAPHFWIKTDSNSKGMGVNWCFFAYLADHKGYDKGTCTPIGDEEEDAYEFIIGDHHYFYWNCNEACIDRRIETQKPWGPWVPGVHDCITWVMGILKTCCGHKYTNTGEDIFTQPMP